MADSATIRIYRPLPTRLNMTAERDSNPLYGVRVDDAEVGSILPEQVLALEVTPGPHIVEVHFRPPYRISRKCKLNVTAGQVVDLGLPSGWISALSGPIWLRRARSGDRDSIARALGEGPRGN